jgi:predicted RNase H-like HicB family nuclease
MKMETLKIIAVIHKDEDTAYWISAPDLPGCMSCGDTINGAIVNFHEAMEMHVNGMIEDNIALPQPREEDEVVAACDIPPVQAITVEIAVPVRNIA